MATRKKGKDLLDNLFEDGGKLQKATGHGVDGDYERVTSMFYNAKSMGVGRRNILWSYDSRRNTWLGT
jgi:hypothetical protein